MRSCEARRDAAVLFPVAAVLAELFSEGISTVPKRWVNVWPDIFSFFLHTQFFSIDALGMCARYLHEFHIEWVLIFFFSLLDLFAQKLDGAFVWIVLFDSARAHGQAIQQGPLLLSRLGVILEESHQRGSFFHVH